jgi:hypothetical protein
MGLVCNDGREFDPYCNQICIIFVHFLFYYDRLKIFIFLIFFIACFYL